MTTATQYTFKAPWGAGLFVHLAHQPIRFQAALPGIPESERPLHTRYLHLDSAFVSAGDRVSAGQLIGTMGASGTETGFVHLHLETLLASVDDFQLREARCLDPRGFVGWHWVRSPDELRIQNARAGRNTNTRACYTIYRNRDGGKLRKPCAEARWGGAFREQSLRFDQPELIDRNGQIFGKTWEVDQWNVLLCFPKSKSKRGEAIDRPRSFTCSPFPANTTAPRTDPTHNATPNFCANKQPYIDEHEPGAKTQGHVPALLPQPFANDLLPKPKLSPITRSAASKLPPKPTPRDGGLSPPRPRDAIAELATRARPYVPLILLGAAALFLLSERTTKGQT